MRAAVARADRWHLVREAANGWLRAGAIDGPTHQAIETAYPDDRVRLGLVFRVLVFGFTVVIVNALFGIFALAVSGAGDQAAQVLLAFFGLSLVAATEIQIGPLRRSQGGSEAATGFLGLCYLLGALLWLIAEGAQLRDHGVNAALILVAMVFGAAAYRWGTVVFAVVAAIGLFLLLARGPAPGRVLWMLVPAVLAPLLLRAAASARLAPSHRRCCEAVALTSLVFLYLAVHVGSWDQGLVGWVRDGHGRWSGEVSRLRPFFVMATALVPVLTLAWGIATRRRLLINAALIGLLASIVTLRFYVQVAPLWVVLLLGGGAAIGLALGLRWYLDSGPDRERHGFTGEPLFADPERRSALEMAAGIARLSPAARPLDPPDFQGGGGRFGGGGASGSF